MENPGLEGWSFSEMYLSTTFNWKNRFVLCRWNDCLVVRTKEAPELVYDYLFYKEGDFYKIMYKGSSVKNNIKVKNYKSFIKSAEKNSGKDVYVIDEEDRVFLLVKDEVRIVNEDIFRTSYDIHNTSYNYYFFNNYINLVYTVEGKIDEPIEIVTFFQVDEDKFLVLGIKNGKFKIMTMYSTKYCPFTRDIFKFKTSSKNIFKFSMTKEEFKNEVETFKNLAYVNMFVTLDIKDENYNIICDYNKPNNDEKNLKEEIIEKKYIGESKSVKIYKTDDTIKKVEVVNKDFVLSFEKNLKTKIYFENIPCEITTYMRNIDFPSEEDIRFDFDYEEIELIN